MAVLESFFAFVTLSAAQGLDSSVATPPQNDSHKKLFLETAISDSNVQSNGGIGFPACAIPEVIPLKLNVHFDCDLV
jgi:hypothetical protein